MKVQFNMVAGGGGSVASSALYKLYLAVSEARHKFYRSHYMKC